MNPSSIGREQDQRKMVAIFDRKQRNYIQKALLEQMSIKGWNDKTETNFTSFTNA